MTWHALPTATDAAAADAGAAGPCFWFEESAGPLRQPAGPFGRAQKGVEERLQALGFSPSSADDGRPEEHRRRSFSFRYPGAPTFCAHRPDLPGPVRQLPASWDEHVDDKLLLHLLLSAADAPRDLSGIAPPTFVVDHTLLAALEEEGEAAAGRDRREGEAAEGHREGEGGPCWFLKHRLDARRPRVHPFASGPALAARLRRTGERSWAHFVAQREVHPPMLLLGGGGGGRKFVLFDLLDPLERQISSRASV